MKKQTKIEESKDGDASGSSKVEYYPARSHFKILIGTLFVIWIWWYCYKGWTECGMTLSSTCIGFSILNFDFVFGAGLLAPGLWFRRVFAWNVRTSSCTSSGGHLIFFFLILVKVFPYTIFLVIYFTSHVLTTNLGGSRVWLASKPCEWLVWFQPEKYIKRWGWAVALSLTYTVISSPNTWS